VGVVVAHYGFGVRAPVRTPLEMKKGSNMMINVR
jgi:hypothetical protein